MEDYHYAWLSTHPDRTEDWLRQRLKDGFAIHHMDGDHSNNDPKNLVLIEGIDHLRLHGMRMRLPENVLEQRAKARARRHDLGRRLYEARSQGESWRKATQMHLQNNTPLGEVQPSRGIQIARDYAEVHGRPWPIDVPRVEVPAYFWRRGGGEG